MATLDNLYARIEQLFIDFGEQPEVGVRAPSPSQPWPMRCNAPS